MIFLLMELADSSVKRASLVVFRRYNVLLFV